MSDNREVILLLKLMTDELKRVADNLEILNQEGIVVFGGQTMEEN